jgi:hypothetical protein
MASRYPDYGQAVTLGPQDLLVRGGVKTADIPAGATNFDPSTLQSIDVSGRDSLYIGGDCDSPSGKLGVVLAYYDGAGGLLSISQGMSIQPGNFYKVGSGYPAIGPPLNCGVAGIAAVRVIITDIKGVWNLRIRLV